MRAAPVSVPGSCEALLATVKGQGCTSTGATGTFDEDSVTKLMVQDFTTRLRDGVTGSGTIRYNITATRIEGAVFRDDAAQVADLGPIEIYEGLVTSVIGAQSGAMAT